MPDPTQPSSAAFITFYSFKGGVGRSMSLINVAGIMAGRGFRVLALDMDLEAPGISYLMRHEAKLMEQTLPGFVDLLSDACTRGMEADLFALSPQDVVEKYSYPYTIPDGIRVSEDGLLRIMPAGSFDGHYQERLDALALGQLYREGRGQPLIAAFKHVIATAGMFDFVFIDSRTGFSDESGICTRDLGDHLVVVMGFNRQNQEGTEEFLRSLRMAGGKPKSLQVILSPVPNGEDELVEKREEEIAAALSEAWEEPLKPFLQIPYHPRLALTEEPHIFRRSRGYLYEAYVAIELAVSGMLGLTAASLRKDIIKAADEKRLDLVILLLKKLQKLDDGETAVEGLVANELMNLCLSPDAGELRQYLAATLPADSWAIGTLAYRLHKKNMDDAGLFYERALEADSEDADILGNYASFLSVVRRDLDAAEAFYKRALEADPKHAINLGNYANFLTDVRRDHDAAEVFYKRALEADPKHANILGNYALFLTDVRKDHDAAEVFYKRALEADPKHAINLGNYALFLTNVRKEHDAAEVYYMRALEADPKDANVLGNYAIFLKNVRKDYDTAEAFYKRALEVDPKAANILDSYANFLIKVRQDHGAAEVCYQRALEAAPKRASTLSNYANFLTDVRKDHDAAEAFYKRALEADPKAAINLGNYAKLLFIQNRLEEGAIMLAKAWEQNPTVQDLQSELLFYACAHLWERHSDALGKLKTLLEAGGKSEDWPLEDNVRVARESGHPHPDFIAALADVVSAKARVDTLADFEVWKNGHF